MKIEQIETIVLEMPYKKPLTTAISSGAAGAARWIRRFRATKAALTQSLMQHGPMSGGIGSRT
jgi:hypothetical protein